MRRAGLDEELSNICRATGVLVDEGGYYNELGKVVDRGIGYAIFDSSLLTNTKKIK